MIGLIASSQHHAYASDGQTPNWQILSSNKNQGNNSWERFSVTTLSTYSVSTSSYTMQMNAIVNACTPSDGCAWWLQSVVGIDSGSLVGKSGGYWVHDAHLEEWNRGSDDSFYSVYPSPLINIEQSAYEAYIQSTIEIGCDYFCSYSDNLDLYVFNAQLQLVAQAHASCSDPNGPISFFQSD
jgi:hypothetical protein